MIFNSMYIDLNHNHSNFRLGSHIQLEVTYYCYLGITIHNSGNFNLAREELKKKAFRSLYGLKNTINKKHLSFRSLTTLFDSLIKPIAIHGAPLWTPNMSIIKHIGKFSSNIVNGENNSLISKFSLLNCEKVHLHFLKWALGINKKNFKCGSLG